MMSAFGFTKYSFLMSNSVLAHSFLFPLLLPGSFQCRLSLQSSLMEPPWSSNGTTGNTLVPYLVCICSKHVSMRMMMVVLV